MKQAFIEAVGERYVEKIQSYIISEIIEDPTFSNKNLQECLDYVKANGINIFVEYEDTPCETTVPENPKFWDKKLFFDKLEDLRLNFAYSERIATIKKIGEVAFVKNENFEEAPPSHGSENKIKWLPIIIGAVVVLAVVVTVIMILAK
jgi:hypothetical protein